jgi:plastocyanin
MKTKLIYIALVILTGAILIYSCSKGNNSSSAAATTTGTTASVSIQNMVFVTDPLNIKTGTPVTCKNHDGVPHTVTSLNNAFDSGNIGAGQTYSFTFATAGTYTYHCLVHSMMKTATVVVTN